MAQSDDAVVDPAKKGRLKVILIVVVALLLAIGLSVGATWYVMHKAQSKLDAVVVDTEAANTRKEAIFEPLTPPFIVNFNVNGRQRYMQVSITMLARNQADLDALKVHMPVIRNNLVMMFSGQPFDTIATPVGIEMLRQKATASIQEVAQKELGKSVIDQLLFTNFVLQ